MKRIEKKKRLVRKRKRKQKLTVIFIFSNKAENR
jgi:hypothetical protein